MHPKTPKPLTIVATIKAKVNHIEQVKSELLQLTKASQSDEGCIQYDLHQDNANLDNFIVYEVWENNEFLQHHVQSPHFQNYIKVTEGMVDEFIITEMTVIS
ncbi:antibiotic biosynthesis monooxygenase [Psychrobacter sp. TAE2020]|uniref:putative quinol monooxygenase n=1 Tax=Psychrobacter sp. TAE2020 TaxID=2846762 RepID=UPI001C0FD007|nr:putative quinol monooxygenase [Psychrobacter sp. TAE2020]MBU5615798.1 antibiotic biosynthesis monooxygenase [Psychrobacter sp. TAE2020]